MLNALIAAFVLDIKWIPLVHKVGSGGKITHDPEEMFKVLDWRFTFQ